ACAAVAAAGAPAANAEPPVFASVYMDGVSAGDYGRAQLGASDTPNSSQIRAAPGETAVPLDWTNGWSVYAILQAADASPNTLDVVGGLSGGAVVYTLTRDEIGSTPNDFCDNRRPALFANGDVMQSIRPLRCPGDSDFNAATQLQGPIKLFGHSGGSVAVS